MFSLTQALECISMNCSEYTLVIAVANTILYFEPLCHDAEISSHNPFGLEVYVDGDSEIEIDHFMYILNGTAGTDSCAFCYFCVSSQRQSLYGHDWGDIVAALEMDGGCSVCTEGLATGSITQNEAGRDDEHIPEFEENNDIF